MVNLSADFEIQRGNTELSFLENLKFDDSFVEILLFADAVFQLFEMERKQFVLRCGNHIFPLKIGDVYFKNADFSQRQGFLVESGTQYLRLPENAENS
ncbi:hypothetical protein SDC9_200388 [bioreactor metagenome]|uniref:Uncharacterized protein n=1 Tax=bioreactor metagenome TaxID=1076179 RepID=A0A645INU9_9ZZZZ